MAVYLRLFHGRDTLGEEMNGFGFDGPVLGPLPFAHVTYGSDIKFDEDYMIQILEGCVAYGGKFYGDFSIFDHESLVACGYTPVAPSEADTVVDPSCRTVDPRIAGNAPNMYEALKAIDTKCGSILRESYNGPDYTTLERKLMWALSQIGDAARSAMVIERLVQDLDLA